nr:C1, subunit of the circadian RNA-binding protein CHLAMY1 [Volvox africanus]
MVDEQRSSELRSGHEDHRGEENPFVIKGEPLVAPEVPQATTEPSVAEAIIDAGRNRALELANLFAAQAGHSANITTETAKRKRDDSVAIEAPENKRPAGDIACLKSADDPAFAPTTATLLIMEGSTSETLLCPPDKVGRIIGRAGATIRDLEASTSTRIQVDHKAMGDKPVVISGRRDDVERAKRSVQDLISGASDSVPPSTGEVQETVECPPGIVGRVIGRGGETIRTLQQASGAHILVNQEFPEGVPRLIVITGTQDAVQRATSMISELINGDHTSTQTVIQRFGVGSTEVVECPKAMVGRIIGKGGETIKDLQKRFNASIQIDQGSTPCKVTITGPSHAISSARRAIEDLVRITIPQPPGGTRSGPPYTSYAHPPYNVATSPYIPYGNFGMAAATYPTSSSYQPYAGYSSYPSTLPPFGTYGSFGAAAPDPYGSSGNYSHQHYASTGTSQQNAGTSAQPPVTSVCPWQVLQDDQGRNYYYNSQTGVSQWEKPADMP